MTLVRWLYARALKLYPRSFQRKFGDELLDVFDHALCDAEQQGKVAILRLVWRELRDIPVAVLRAHQSGAHAFDHMLRRKIAPVAWNQIALAITLGVLDLASPLRQASELVRFIVTWTPLALTLSAVWVFLRKTPCRIPVWGLILIGAFFGLGLNTAIYGTIFLLARSPFAIIAIVCLSVGWLLVSLRLSDHSSRRRLSLIATGLILLPILILSRPDNWVFVPLHLTLFVNVIAGLYIARYSGLRAGLFVLGAGVPLMSFNIEQAIYFQHSEHGRAWLALLNLSVPMLLYVVTPIWVLRARSVASQAAGLVLPIGIYFVLLVWGLVDAGASSSLLSRAISIAQPALLLMMTMVYAVVLYMLVWNRDADASLTQTDDA